MAEIHAINAPTLEDARSQIEKSALAVTMQPEPSPVYEPCCITRSMDDTNPEWALTTIAGRFFNEIVENKREPLTAGRIFMLAALIAYAGVEPREDEKVLKIVYFHDELGRENFLFRFPDRSKIAIHFRRAAGQPEPTRHPSLNNPEDRMSRSAEIPRPPGSATMAGARPISIPVWIFIPPDGKKEAGAMQSVKEIAEKAGDIILAGHELHVEQLRTGEFSFTIFNEKTEEDVAIELSGRTRGQIAAAFDKLINNFYETMPAEQRLSHPPKPGAPQ